MTDLTKTERVAASRRAVAAAHAADPTSVPRYEARMARLAAVRRRQLAGWCVLRTDPRSTLKLADTLNVAGIAAWTPKRTVKRTKQGRRRLIDGKPVTFEVTLPILPSFVFAPADHLEYMLAIAGQPVSPHPAYSVFRYGDRFPLIAASEIAGLRRAEADAQVLLDQMREAEAREERRRIRADAAKNDRERKKALRAERRHFAAGEAVSVRDMPALAGMRGVVEEGDGRSAVVVFGGALRMRIEAWQLVSDYVSDPASVAK